MALKLKSEWVIIYICSTIKGFKNKWQGEKTRQKPPVGPNRRRKFAKLGHNRRKATIKARWAPKECI